MTHKAKVILQPIDTGDGTCHPRASSGWTTMLRPGVFFWYAGQLYVGYGWLSSFHADEKPVWDPTPVPLGAYIETCCGYYHFCDILVEGVRYFRKFAVLEHLYLYQPNAFCQSSRRMGEKIGHGAFEIRERIIMPPGCYLEYQWAGGFASGEQLLNRKWKDGRSLVRKIKRAPSLHKMRIGKEVNRLRREFFAAKDCNHKLIPGRSTSN